MLGDARVRQQIAVCSNWPRGEVGGDSLVDIQHRLLTTARVRGLDTSCVRDPRLGPFTLPDGVSMGA